MRPSPYKRLKAIEQIQRIGKLPDYFNLLPFAGGIFFQREGFNPRYKITIGSAVATIHFVGGDHGWKVETRGPLREKLCTWRLRHIFDVIERWYQAALAPQEI